MKKDFDAIVIGSGQSGPFLAARMAAAGQRVATIKRRRFGGTCVKWNSLSIVFIELIYPSIQLSWRAS
jgi:pyruvate/2-oxoglutarate dehydrogenase complex dihydrolipoamide dehydrogenase (E3) component